MEADRTGSVLVTGARGFIGHAVCQLLQREGYRVVALDQSRAGEEPGNAARAEIQCDIRDAPRLESFFRAERIDAIVHLAAVLPTAAQHNPLQAIQVNIGGSLNLLDMAGRFRVRRMVFGSSLSVYGSCQPEERVSETCRAAPEDLYGAAKLCIERLGEACLNRYHLEFVALRIGRVVGAGARSSSSPWRSEIFERLQSAQPTEMALPFVGHERILLLHVADVASMLVQLLQAARPSHVIYNAPCESVTVTDLQRELESLNPNLAVKLGNAEAVGNPRRLDSSRFENEFGFHAVPIFDQLKRGAAKMKA